MRSLLILALILFVPEAARAEEHPEETRRLAVLAIDRMLEGQARIMRVAEPIRVAGTPFCGDEVGPVLGLYPLDERSFRSLFEWNQDLERDMMAAAAERLGIEKRPKILLVVPGLPADLGGVRPGDVVVGVHGKKAKRRDRIDVLKKLEDPVRLRVERSGELLDLSLPLEVGCRLPSRYWWGTNINAFAMRWGKLTGMYVVGGLLEFLPDDDDLAVVLGHELAHLILQHAGFRTTRNTEADADYMGLYLAARAGFEVSRAPEIWERMARENPYSGIDWGFYSHPASAERALALAATLDEIARKREAGEPLEPETDR